MRLALTASSGVPLAVMLLVAMPAVQLAPPLARALAWLGEASWGIYLGQTLIHDSLHTSGMKPEEAAALAYRWLYFAILLAGSVALVHAGNAARRAFTRERYGARRQNAQPQHHAARGAAGLRTRQQARASCWCRT